MILLLYNVHNIQSISVFLKTKHFNPNHNSSILIHSFIHSFGTYLPTYLPTCLPTYIHTYLPTYLSICIYSDPSTLKTCSGRGVCDGETGICLCEPGRDGLYCEKQRCPTTPVDIEEENIEENSEENSEGSTAGM